MRILLLLAAVLSLFISRKDELPRGELLFPLQNRHNHGSCIVELPNRDLMVCWYNGTGERTADDVEIVGARRTAGSTAWTKASTLADTVGFPDCNPCMTVDNDGKLWLFWPVILDNQWESALLKYRVTGDLRKKGSAPVFKQDGVVHIKPGPEFQETVERELRRVWEPYGRAADSEQKLKLETYLSDRIKASKDKLAVRLGWMPRAHPFVDGGRMILPLYSDGFDLSLMAITDNGGRTWKTTAPLVGVGNVQPSIVKRRDGTLVAFFRDNGPPPQRVIVSESKDRGDSWSTPVDSAVVDTGAGVEVISLKSGRWILVNNDTERGRRRLAVHVSEDEGRTWLRTRYIENDPDGPDTGSYSYPSVMQARDGIIHVTYSYRPPKNKGVGSSIKHVQFPEAWIE